MKANWIILLIRLLLWIGVIGLGFWYLYDSINGSSLTYVSLDQFMNAIGACENGTCSVNSTSCLLCPYIETLLYLITGAAFAIYDTLIRHTWILLVFGMAIFILFHTYKTLKDSADQTTKLDAGERKIDFAKYWEPIQSQGIRLLLVGGFLGVLGFSGSSMMTTISSLTVTPILSVGNSVAMSVTNIDGKYCTSHSNPSELNLPDWAARGVDSNATLVSKSIMDPFLCTIGNVNTIMLAGASGGFALMNFGWFDNHMLHWIMGIALVLMFLFIGFEIVFDIMNIIFSLAILVVFLPLIIASYAFKYKLFEGVGPNAIGTLAKSMVKMVGVTLKITIIYVMVLFASDKFFPGPVDGYTALFPPEIGLNLSATDASELMARPQIAKIFSDCEQYARTSDGTPDKTKFKQCFMTKKSQTPEYFDFLNNSFEFFWMMIGLFIFYHALLREKIDKTFLAGGNMDFFKFGQNVESLFKTGFKNIQKLPGILIKPKPSGGK